MYASKSLIFILLLFPWRSPLWDFAQSEAIYTLLIFVVVMLLSINKQILVAKTSIYLIIIASIIFSYNTYFDFSLIARLLLPVILIPFFQNYHITQKELKLFAIISLFFVFLNYLPFATLLVDPYKGRESTGLATFQYFRASGLHVYPSDFAFFALLLIIRLKDSVVLKTLLGLAIILSASRAGIFFYLIFLFLINFKKSFVILLVSLPFLPFLIKESPYLDMTFSRIFEGRIDGSVKHRASELDYMYEILTMKMPPVLKDYSALGIDILEGFYSYYIINYGLLGLILVLLLIGYYFNQIKKLSLDPRIRIFILFTLLSWFVASDILNHTKNLFFGYMLIFSRDAIYNKSN